MTSARSKKVAEVLRRKISNIIQTELKDPRIGFVTVIRIKLTPDLRQAKIYFSVLGTEEEIEKTAKGLTSATGFIRGLIGDSLKLRYTPELEFVLDKSVEENTHLTQVFDKIKDEEDHVDK